MKTFLTLFIAILILPATARIGDRRSGSGMDFRPRDNFKWTAIEDSAPTYDRSMLANAFATLAQIPILRSLAPDALG